MATIASQDFNALPGTGTSTTDTLTSGSELTNSGSKNVGGAGLDFRTYFIDTRSTQGPKTPSNDTSDFVGVNSFAGASAPNVSPGNDAVSEAGDHNFEFNDGDGRLELRFDPVDTTGYTGRTVSLNYWINNDTFEGADALQVILTDGTTSVTVLNLDATALNSNKSADDGSANWKSLTVDVDAAITANGLNAAQLRLIVAVDTDASAENVFVDNVVFAGATPGGGASVSIGDVSITEGNSGTQTLTFTVTRSDNTGAFTLDYATGDGTATAGSDYLSKTGSLSFAAGGPLTQTVSITVNGDTAVEGNETFNVTLSNLVSSVGTATFGKSSAVGTITNDDQAAGNITLIHDIQGAGTASALVGQSVTIEGIVVGDFATGASGSINGFFVQEENADADSNAATSEGIFVFTNGAASVNVGDKVRVTGTVTEFNGETQIGSSPSITVLSTANALPDAAVVSLPVLGTVLNSFGVPIADLEAYEGMRVTIPETMTLTELFNLDRFGEYKVSSEGRLDTFTAVSDPSVAGYAQHLQDIAKRTITVDDGFRSQNPNPIVGSDASLSTADSFRMGETVQNLTGVIRFSIATNEISAGSSNQSNYRLLPTVNPTFSNESENPLNPRPANPEDVGGTLKIASANVLNYFRTLDTSSSVTTAVGLEPRGANNATEFARQTEKLVNVLIELDADILNFCEIENDFLPGAPGNAIEYLVAQLNAELGAGTYAWVNPGSQFIGTDAISVGMIYKPSKVQIASGTTVATLTDPVMSRPALAVTFQELATGEKVTVVGNHFKSKSTTTAPTGADIDHLDGQGAYNAQRLEQANAVKAWLLTNPTGAGDTDFAIVGDLNAYLNEDPIKALVAGGYTPVETLIADQSQAYSYTFDGQQGSLDYILTNSSLTTQITGQTIWHINADEADAIDYNTDFGRDPAIFDGTVLARQSDHDPILIGVRLNQLDNTFIGEAAADTIHGGDGTDVVDGATGNDILFGDAGNDAIYGGYGADIIDGGTGNDSIFGLTEEDTIHGGDGADGIAGEQGNDVLFGDAGNDYILGGDNEDTIDGGDDNDSLFGDAGFDTISGGKGDDSIDGGAGIDTVHGGDGNDYVVGGSDGDNLFGDAGNDALFGGDGVDVLAGGEGADSLDGGADADYLYGNAGDDWLVGQTGNDSLFGGDNTDVLFGGEGADSLYGDAGNDQLDGGTGADILSGGAGADVFAFAPGWGDDRIQDFEDGVDLVAIVDPSLTAFGQLVITQVGADTLIAYAGNSITLVNTQAANLSSSDFYNLQP